MTVKRQPPRAAGRSGIAPGGCQEAGIGGERGHDPDRRHPQAWSESPSLTLLGEPPRYWEALAANVTAGQATGPLVYDARIATICQLHGVRELWTADHDFSRFPGIAVWNPLVADAAHETPPAYRANRQPSTAMRNRAGARTRRVRRRADRS